MHFLSRYHALICSHAIDKIKHAKSILPSLNQRLSSCFYSGLTVAESLSELSHLTALCIVLIYEVSSYYLSFTSVELLILQW